MLDARVLVVEDERAQRQLLADMLEGAGCSVTEAGQCGGSSK